MLAIYLALAGLAASAPAPTKQIWQPAAGTTWQIVLNQKLTAEEALKVDAQAYDLDLFETDKTTIDGLHAKGKKVICYFSAGSYEPYRPDSSQFQSADMGSVMDGWPDEKWLKTDSANVRNIMTARIALAASKGCDGIDPDNLDGFSNSNGAGLTKAGAVSYIQFLSKQATSAGMSIGLKNSGEIASQVQNDVHFVVNEQCHEYTECATFQPYIKANKAVFNIEYPGSVSGLAKVASGDSSCYPNAAGSVGFSIVLKNMDLDTSVTQCPCSAGYENAAPRYIAAPGSGVAPSTGTSPGYGSAPVPSPIATKPASPATTKAPAPATTKQPAKPSGTKVSSPTKTRVIPYPTGTSSGRPFRPNRPGRGKGRGHGRKGRHGKKRPSPTPEPEDDDQDNNDDEGDDDDDDDE